jgi:hypothetical protein
MNDFSQPAPAPPSPADHVALRALIKYMSRILRVTYKEIAREAKTDESAVKNYANDKSTTAPKALETYTELYKACAKLVEPELKAAPPDAFLTGALTHLFGDAWVRAKGIRPQGIRPIKEPVDRALGRWAHVSALETGEVEVRYRGLWRVVRASTHPNHHAGEAAQFQPREIDCSLLNVRPRGVGGGTLCDFKLYYLGRGRRHHERLQFEGFVLPNVDRLEFFGRAQNRHDLLE